jgi:type I restriction enzyme S subunit
MCRLVQGALYPAVRPKDIRAFGVSVPRREKQPEIVAEIEKQFTRLEAGVAGLRRVQANLKRYRAAVLKAACEGKLVPTEAELARQENRSYETGAQLLEAILTERRQKWNGKEKYKELTRPDTADLPQLPEGWSYALITALLSQQRAGMKTGPFGTLLKKSDHRPSGIPVLGIENIENMKFVPGSKIHITREKALRLASYRVERGDIIISRSGTVGEVCVVPADLGDAVISTNLLRVSLQACDMSPRFFCLLFNGSPFVLGQVQELCKGSTRSFLNQHILNSVIFPLPPSPEQDRIVAEAERRLSVVEELEAVVKANLQRTTRLRQSILQQAFEGKL